MASTFPVPDIKDVALAAGEILARARAGTIAGDIPLLNNQLSCGVFPYVSTLAAGSVGSPTPPGPIVPIGFTLSEARAEHHLAELAAKGEAAVPKGSQLSVFVKVVLKMVLTQALVNIPEPWKTQLQDFINKFLT